MSESVEHRNRVGFGLDRGFLEDGEERHLPFPVDENDGSCLNFS